MPGAGNMKRLHHLRTAGMVFFSTRLAITVAMVFLATTIIGCAEPLPAPTPTPDAKPTSASSVTPSITPISTPESTILTIPSLSPISFLKFAPEPIQSLASISAPESTPVQNPTQDKDLTTTTTVTEPRPTVKDLSNIYIGCMHSAHTNFSDGRLLYPNEFYSKFKSLWDWISTTDHDTYLGPSKLQNIVENADVYNSKDFISFFGDEWSSSIWGHMSVIFKGDRLSKPSVMTKSSDPNYDNPQKLYAFLNATDGLAVFAHPALSGLHIDFNRESDYKNNDVACLAEIFGIANTIHWNATWDYADGKTITVPGTDNAYNGGWIKTALDRGYRLGFVAALDLHEKDINPLSYRYTGVVANNLTREGTFDALKSRHTYAVMSPSGLGKRILLRADAGNYMMGDIFDYDCNMINVTLQGKTDLAQFTLINLFVNGKIVQSRAVSGRDFIEDFMVSLVDGDNYTFFEVRALSADGQVSQAFTSPMYVTVKQARD
jgi:hypothetical protein